MAQRVEVVVEYSTIGSHGKYCKQTFFETLVDFSGN